MSYFDLNIELSLENAVQWSSVARICQRLICCVSALSFSTWAISKIHRKSLMRCFCKILTGNINKIYIESFSKHRRNFWAQDEKFSSVPSYEKEWNLNLQEKTSAMKIKREIFPCLRFVTTKSKPPENDNGFLSFWIENNIDQSKIE